MRDLVRHQGGVHRWAAGIVATPRTEAWTVDLEEVAGGWPADEELFEWFGEGHAALVEALSSAAADLECWTFLSALSPRAMWARRQAHETTIHRVDTELSAGPEPSPVSPEFAADGIDELLSCFITRPSGRLRADVPCTLGVRCTDTPGSWLVRIGSAPAETVADWDGAGADCVVSGPAARLYLALWNRAGTAELDIGGRDDVVALFRDVVKVRWA